jgi:hypothetical protein
MTGGDPLTYLEFHNAVMRWKCSLLTDEERQEHQDWIDQRALKEEEEMEQPWKAAEETGSDELYVENTYIQRLAPSHILQYHCRLTRRSSCIDALPNTIEKALEQIERSTRMKAIILIGGPTPAANGDISTHW